ncbi:MAG: hypothetical protein ACFE78_12675 [Candidatus Hodarchaeota archaeon]
MSNNRNSYTKDILIGHLKDLHTIYDNKEKVGICFKLQRDGNPLDILGVLDFLKYKIKKWRNTNIFSYRGKLFNEYTILVIGSNTIEETKDIVVFIFLNDVLVKKKDIFKIGILDDWDSDNDLEQYLINETLKNLEKGYPYDPNLESEISNHIEKLMKD